MNVVCLSARRKVVSLLAARLRLCTYTMDTCNNYYCYNVVRTERVTLDERIKKRRWL